MSNFMQSLSAFGAGILSFFAPCVLPLLPAYICFITGLSLEEFSPGKDISLAKRRLILGEAVLFVLGFSLVFIALGASASLFGAYFIEYKTIVRALGGIVLIVFGLQMLGVFKIKFLQYERRIHLKAKPISWLGSFMVGMAFGFGWTPCVGPMLAAILTLAATSDTLRKGVILLSLYSLGLALPFLLISMGVKKAFGLLIRLKPHFKLITAISGVLLVIIGITILVPLAVAASAEPAADFVLPTLEGENLQLSDFKGKIIILTFWATSCPSCQKQVTVLTKLYDQYNDKGLIVIGVSLDQGKNEALSKFSKRLKINYPIVVGDRKVVKSYGGVAFIPTAFIIDQKMNIVEKHVGFKSFEFFEAKIKKLLGE
ncbi:MAG: redoxin domain-containing protein [Candidatus Omnitrophica bacterium]|nr:redoxin domain-containing protein [Candidatus Omnitrophota bacterium]